MPVTEEQRRRLLRYESTHASHVHTTRPWGALTLVRAFLTLARCGFLVAYPSGFHERFHEFRASFSFTNM